MFRPFKRLVSSENAKKRWQLHLRKLQQFDNFYHCCTQKTASQWFKSIFGDPLFLKYISFENINFSHWRQNIINDGMFPETESMLQVSRYLYTGFDIQRFFPPKKTAVHFYVGYHTFRSIPKSDNYRAFFILRDPRDIVVSWYFSILNSHAPQPQVIIFRNILKSLSKTDGLKYSVDAIQRFGLFEGQRSWVDNVNSDKNVRIFRYEQLSKDNSEFLKDLFLWLEIDMPDKESAKLIQRHQFQSYSSGRRQGEENVNSHYRKGIAGDWKNHMNSELISYFSHRTGNLIDLLGYGG